MAKKTRKRWLALLMALVMAIGVLPISALADGTDPVDEQYTKQIVSDTNEGGTAYYKADGTKLTSSSGADVAISKTIAATGTENLFDVTVNV